MIVIGAGAWGTALAFVLARNGTPVFLCGYAIEEMKIMAEKRENPFYLPHHPFPENLQICLSLTEAFAQAQTKDILVAVPSHAFRAQLIQLMPYWQKGTRLMWATKGLDSQKTEFLHEVVESVCGKSQSMAVLSGPSFARETAAQLPTAVALAANDPVFAKDLVTRFHNKFFRLYLTDDILGVELGGAIKNVYAIAAGISDGLGFGANARCALITRALAEMMRLGQSLGAKAETLIGLAGMGDLVLTCTDDQSRNRRFGLAIGSGIDFEAAFKSVGGVVEGKQNAEIVAQLAQRETVEMPIAEQVCRVLRQEISPQQAVEALLSRQIKS